MSAAAYTAHLNNTVVPALHAVREEIGRIDADIRDYEQVVRRLSRVEGDAAHSPLAEMGAGVWVDTTVPSTASVTLDLGLGVHMSLPAADARTYAAQRAGVLRKKREALVQREERLRWEVEQFEGAVRQVGARESAAEA